jgi:uncharacterized damage-inducible protein DinB
MPPTEKTWRTAVASQYGAALEMMGNAIDASPDELWTAETEEPHFQFWYIVSHTLFWTDYYLSVDSEGFAPPAPFGLEEMDPAGVMPPRAYTKDELRGYLAHCRSKLTRSLSTTMDMEAWTRHGSARPEITVGEGFLYSLRHVQHHVGQLQMLLRVAGVEPPRWVKHPTPRAGAGR